MEDWARWIQVLRHLNFELEGGYDTESLALLDEPSTPSDYDVLNELKALESEASPDDFMVRVLAPMTLGKGPLKVLMVLFGGV